MVINFYFDLKKGIVSGYLNEPVLNAEKMLTVVVIIPKRTTAAVKKKFIPGKGKNNNKEIIKYNVIEQ